MLKLRLIVIYEDLKLSFKHLDFSGTYASTGFDQNDGYFSKLVILELDAKNSDFGQGYAAYHYYSKLEDGTVLYRGAMVASGNHLSLAFNSAAGQADDHGIASGVVAYDADENGRFTTRLNFFYYQPEYRGGGRGSVTCVKQ